MALVVTRKRSPDYPMYGLGQCVVVGRKIFSKIHSFSAARETAAIAGGFKGITGTSLSMLSALQKFGLMTAVGRDLKFSELGLKVFAPQSKEEYASALWEAAFHPSLFQELRELYHGMVPSDELLRSNLLRRGFLADSADKAIEAYKDTLSLVSTTQMGQGEAATQSGLSDAASVEESASVACDDPPAVPESGRVVQMETARQIAPRQEAATFAGENRPLGRLRRRVVLDDGLLEVNAVVDLRGLPGLIRLLQAQEKIMQIEREVEDL